MSFNQSKSDKSQVQYRKTGRSASFNPQRASSGGGYGKRGGSGPAPQRSFRNHNHNAQGGQQPRANLPQQGENFMSSSGSGNAPTRHSLQNGQSNAAVASGGAKVPELLAVQRDTRPGSKAPNSQSTSGSSDAPASLTPSKTPEDVSKAFPFQFGSISPSHVNGMQIPARTSSAPPNLDEQKRNQALYGSFKPASSLPMSLPKHQLPRKDQGYVDHSNNSGDAQLASKVNKDVEGIPAPSISAPNMSQMQKAPVVPMSRVFMQMSFPQSQDPVQFGGPGPQIQSQGVGTPSHPVPMPMPIPMGNSPQVQRQIFIPGLQPHPVQPHGIMHQQSLSFSNQMGQLPHQLGNLAFSPQYAQQQGRKFSSPRKAPVKITDPKTHEELKFEKHVDTYSDGGASGARTHPNLPPQLQPITSYQPSQQVNYYTNSCNPSTYFPVPSSVPLISSQVTPNSQVPRFNYPINQGAQNISFMNPSSPRSIAGSKGGTLGRVVTELPNLEHAHDAHNVVSFTGLATAKVPVKPATVSCGKNKVDEKGESPRRPALEKNLSHPPKDSVPSSRSQSAMANNISESLVSTLLEAGKQVVEVPPAVSAASLVSNSLPSSVISEEYPPVIPTNEGKIRQSVSQSNSIKEQEKKSGKKEQISSQHEVGRLTNAALSLSTYVPEHGVSCSSGVCGSGIAKTILGSSVATEGFSESNRELQLGDNASGPSAPQSYATGVPSQSSHLAEQDDSFLHDGGKKYETVKAEEREVALVDGPRQSTEISLNPSSLNAPEIADIREQDVVLGDIANSNEIVSAAIGGVTDEMEVFILTNSDLVDNGHAQVNFASSVDSIGANSSTLEASSSIKENAGGSETSDTKSCVSNQMSDSKNVSAEATTKHRQNAEKIGGLQESGLKGNTEMKRPAARGKKKQKEILQKADAQGTISDLYNAYKGPEENKEVIVSTLHTDNAPSTSSTISKQITADTVRDDSTAREEVEKSKGEPDDWEDAADMSSSGLETSCNREKVHSGSVDQGKAGDENVTKKYSRDFLLKFAGRCTDLPDGFEITADIAEVLMSATASTSYSSAAWVTDRPSGGPRLDRRGSGLVGDDRWSKLPGSFGPSRDPRMDVGYGNNAGLRPGGVLRNPLGHIPLQFSGGILSGPIQNFQGGLQRNYSDADRWQRVGNFQQKGLIPSPQAPVQMMHKAEKKYEIGRVADEEEAKQRQLKGILNKLTPQNFEKLFEQVKAVNIDNTVTLTGVISQIFDKALMEPTFCEMYANFCCCLAGELPDFSKNNEKITFKRLLLNKCQEEFERGESEQEEANKTDEGESKMTEEEREEKRVKARRRMLGNIRLIGELYKKKMLTERIMHECIKKLLGQSQVPEEEDIEALCKLMTTIGDMIDHSIAKDHMDAYFEKMAKLSNNMQLSSRVRFMLKDAIDLRKNKWQQRRKVEGPKKIEEVHRDAVQERQTQASRLARGPGINPSARRGPSLDLGSRGPALASPNTHMGGYRGLQPQVRGYGMQDIRFEERQPVEARILSVPLTQRSAGEDSITLGPQGGLARGMSSTRGPSSISSTSDISPNPGDSRRVAASLNACSSASDRTPYSQNRFAGPAAYEQSAAQDRHRSYANRDLGSSDCSSNRALLVSSPMQGQQLGPAQSVASEVVWPEERLRDMSMAAIKEFYSARDEKEVALCIIDLNSPTFHPSMISLWVADSFERKDMERDLLAKLLVNLTKSRDGIVRHSHIVKGFEYVFSTLEDAVNDAPRAPVFLSHMLAKFITENVISLREIGQLLKEGGEEPGSLCEAGLAADVIGGILELIKSEKGESVLNKILRSSSLRLEDFRPQDPHRSKKLDKFI